MEKSTRDNEVIDRIIKERYLPTIAEKLNRSSILYDLLLRETRAKPDRYPQQMEIPFGAEPVDDSDLIPRDLGDG